MSMVILQIYSLDDDNTIISTLCEGEHPIGRDKLNCKDMRISRNHALIVITKNEILFKSTHINPSFYKPYGGNSIRLVKTDETVSINDGDQFGFLADAFWFKTRVIESNNTIKRPLNETELEKDNKRIRVGENENTSICIDSKENVLEQVKQMSNEDGSNSDTCVDSRVIESNNTIKRPFNETELEKDNKRIRVGENENTSICIDSKENVLEQVKQMSNEDGSNSDTCVDSANVFDTEQHEMLKLDKTLNDNRNNQLDENLRITEIKEDFDINEHTVENTDKNEIATELINSNEDTSNKDNPPAKTTKPKCWYGAKCFRKNIVHKQEYSHPGDQDYDENDVPDCPFGSACYRTNVLHRQQYKHNNPPAPKPTLNLNVGNTSNQDTSDDETNVDDTTGRKRREAATKVNKYMESPEDDYDLEDPFINDNSSDDFELSESDENESDSEWQDSQEVEEEIQERRRLIKEAKKFTRKKK